MLHACSCGSGLRRPAGLAAGVAVALAAAGCGGAATAPRRARRARAARRPRPRPRRRGPAFASRRSPASRSTTRATGAERAGLTLAVSGYVGKYGNGRYNVRCVKVLRQSPVAGERLAKGSAVYVLLKECRTPKTAPVPPAGTT